MCRNSRATIGRRQATGVLSFSIAAGVRLQKRGNGIGSLSYDLHLASETAPDC